METVFKYSLPEVGANGLELPKGAKVISADVQGQMICLWAIVNPEAPKETRQFVVAPTGNGVDVTGLDFIQTTFTVNGLVWHVFEDNREAKAEAEDREAEALKLRHKHESLIHAFYGWPPELGVMEDASDALIARVANSQQWYEETSMNANARNRGPWKWEG